MGTIIAWVISHGWRQMLGAAIMLSLFVFVLFWNHHERNIGDANCEGRHDAASVAAQGIADKITAPANAQIHTDIDAITAPIPDYLRIYGDRSKPADCPDVPYVRKIKVNQ